MTTQDFAKEKTEGEEIIAAKLLQAGKDLDDKGSADIVLYPRELTEVIKGFIANPTGSSTDKQQGGLLVINKGEFKPFIGNTTDSLSLPSASVDVSNLDLTLAGEHAAAERLYIQLQQAQYRPNEIELVAFNLEPDAKVSGQSVKGLIWNSMHHGFIMQPLLEAWGSQVVSVGKAKQKSIGLEANIISEKGMPRGAEDPRYVKLTLLSNRETKFEVSSYYSLIKKIASSFASEKGLAGSPSGEI